MRQSALEPERYGRDHVPLISRARNFARRHGLPIKMLKVARLYRHPLNPKERAWRLRIDQQLLNTGMTITVLLEGRPYVPEDGPFLALGLPPGALDGFQLNGNERSDALYLSAEEWSFLKGINCRDLDASVFLRPLETMK